MKIQNKYKYIGVILLALMFSILIATYIDKYLSIYRLDTNSNVYNTSRHTPDHLYKIDIYVQGNCMSRKIVLLPFGLDNDIVIFRVYDKNNNNVANYVRISCVSDIRNIFVYDDDCKCIVYWWDFDNAKPIYINPSRIERLITNSIDKILN